MARLAERTGRRYHIVDYTGHPEAERVLVVMGSGGETVARDRRRRSTRAASGSACVQVRLYRPFPAQALRRRRCPRRVRRIAVLDRTKEPGSIGEPLFLDVGRRADRVVRRRRAGGDAAGRRRPLRPVVEGVHAGHGRRRVRRAGARAAAAPVHDRHQRRRLRHEPRPTTPSLDIEPPDTVRAVFFGLGSDGTVGANKNTIKILGAEEGLHAQGYFVYDSKKSGSQTVSHLRFGPQPIRAPYLVQQASFVGCHQFGLLERVDVLGRAAPTARRCCSTARTRRTRCGTRCRARCRSRSSPSTSTCTRSTPAGSPARSASPGGSTSSCRPASSRSPACCRASEAIERIKAAIAKTYGRRGAEVVERNQAAVDRALEGLHRVEVPERVTATPRAAAARARARAGVRPHRHRAR